MTTHAGTGAVRPVRADEPEKFYIVDLRPKWNRNPYVTFWRPNNEGYCYPLAWAGKYTAARIIEGGRYYTDKEGSDDGPGRLYTRFAVRCADVEALGEAPDTKGRGRVDGNTGPVLRMSAAMRNTLRRLRYVPPRAKKALTPDSRSASWGRAVLKYGECPMTTSSMEAGAVSELAGRKALSIMQPWAWLIVNGHKDIENRDWRCHRRGPVLIHAGKRIDRDAMDDLRDGRHPVTGERLDIDLPETFDVGGIVGEAVIAGCVDTSTSAWFVGRFGIVMRDARPLPFAPCKGALGFFVPDLSGALSGALKRAADAPLPRPVPVLTPAPADPQADLFATSEASR